MATATPAVGLLSKGITIGYKEGSGNTYTTLNDLMEIPNLDIFPTEKVDVTTLADGSKRYIKGIGDTSDFALKFLYDNKTADTTFRKLAAIAKAGDTHDWELSFPDGTKFNFSGQLGVSIDSAGVNAALTFTATIVISSAITIVDPTTA